jgi:hypothetical protein
MKALKNYYLILSMPVIIFLFTDCGSSREAGIEDMAELKTIVEGRDFEIQNEWAEPIVGSSINLIGNPNYIRFEGDSVEMALPYFGERHSGGAYSREGGIHFDGPARNFSITERSNNLIIEFEGQQNSESYNFLLTVFPNGKVTTSVNSSQRSSITYRGEIQSQKLE